MDFWPIRTRAGSTYIILEFNQQRSVAPFPVFIRKPGIHRVISIVALNTIMDKWFWLCHFFIIKISF